MRGSNQELERCQWRSRLFPSLSVQPFRRRGWTLASPSKASSKERARRSSSEKMTSELTTASQCYSDETRPDLFEGRVFKRNGAGEESAVV